MRAARCIRVSGVSLAAALALVAAFLFALAAALQQKGALNLPTISLADPKSFVRLLGEKMWLIGTLALFSGYVFQAAALDRGRLSIIQPLLVTTVVFALPLGYFLTKQHVGRREVIGAAVILVGLALFVHFGDPAGGKDNASNAQWAITIGLISGLSVLLLVFGSAGGLSMKAAVYGTVAGMLFGLSSALTKPTLDYLHQSVATMLSHWECYALAVAGRARIRPAAGVARHGTARPLGRNRVGREPGGRHPDRVAPARRDPQPSRLAHRAGRDRPQPGARRRRRHLARARSRQRSGHRTASRWRVRRRRSRTGAMNDAGFHVVLYAIVAAASPLVLTATFLVIRSARPRTNGIAFLIGFVFGTALACILGLIVGQAAVDALSSHDTVEDLLTLALGLVAAGLRLARAPARGAARARDEQQPGDGDHVRAFATCDPLLRARWRDCSASGAPSACCSRCWRWER